MKIDLRNGRVVFLDGNILVNGNIDARPGNSIPFESRYQFALFIKDFMSSPRKARRLPYFHRSARSIPSPDVSNDLSFVATRTGKKYRLTLHLKGAGSIQLGAYSYGVTVVDSNGQMVTIDPQIIVR